MKAPSDSADPFAEGQRLLASGSVSAAICAFEQAVRLEPQNADCHLHLGLAYLKDARHGEAAAALGKAIELAPNSFAVWETMSSVFASQGDSENALRAAQRAVQLAPNEPSAYTNLARALQAHGAPDQARQAQRRALGIHLNAAQNLARRRRFDAAWEQVNAALRLEPDFPHAHHCAGIVAMRENRLAEAAASFRRAIALQPDRPEFWTHLAQVEMRRKALPDARESLRRALELDAHSSDANYLQGWLDLAQGHFDGAWAKLEPRWIQSGPRDPNCPIWNGEALKGQTILLYLNHGFGDTLHFVRYAPVVAARGARVLLECKRELKSLLETVPGIHAVFANGETLPPFDCQASLLSLPRLLRTTLHQIPNDIPYLRALESNTVGLPEGGTHRLKVGLVWSGSPLLIFDQNRSIPLAAFAPLFSFPQVAYYSLQVGRASEQLREFEMANKLIDLAPQLTDFAATASAVEQMDVVITVDTSVAHLAGALGKRVWVLLRYFADWRWMIDRTDSPWYPTMTLFRQTQFNEDWSEVIVRVRAALAGAAKS